MRFHVVALRRADEDVRHIANWLAGHSLQCATAWLEAYDDMLSRLANQADSCEAALEDFDPTMPLKHAFFRTKRGRMYRAVFTIIRDQVRILRIRGPGQPPLTEDELL
jgi:hypothetical protein